ncbi:MAG: helix-turn-helix domain-containing protein [Syntrophales bacterium LBB04]|nr:helix-turn-helix domain-containing protein [Syntrophales bacterium LBB04]
MLEPTRKRHTKAIELKFIGPAGKRKEAVEALKPLGFVDTSDSIPWREAFPEITDELLPGACLAGARHKENLTQRQLAEMTGIPQRHISEMENGKRPIGKERAKLFAKTLNAATYRLFL